VFQNSVVRRIFGPKRNEVTGGCRKLHNEEFHNLYAFHIIIRMIKSRAMRWAGHVTLMWERRNSCSILVGKPGGKRQVDNIKIDIREIGWDGMDWIDLAQDRDRWMALVNTLRKLRVP
jgi:hypothetical protein